MQPGDSIGEISQDELKDAIQEAELKLKDAEREDAELTLFEEKERNRRSEAIGRVKRAVTLARETSNGKLRIAKRVDASNDRLHAQKLSWRHRSCSNRRKNSMKSRMT